VTPVPADSGKVKNSTVVAEDKVPEKDNKNNEDEEVKQSA